MFPLSELRFVAASLSDAEPGKRIARIDQHAQRLLLTGKDVLALAVQRVAAKADVPNCNAATAAQREGGFALGLIKPRRFDRGRMLKSC